MTADLRLWALRGAFDVALEHQDRAYYWIGRWLEMLPVDVGAAALAHGIACRNVDLAAEAAGAFREFLSRGKKP